MSPTELISFVKKTPLDDSEAQQLIDILLNKQAGSSTQNGDWVEPGKASSTGGEVKQLQKALKEKEEELSEQEVVVNGLTQKLAGLRQELNAAKSGQVRERKKGEEL